MVRHEVVAQDFMYAEIRLFLRADVESPYYQVGWDLDTEWVSYFESPTATHGTMVLAPFNPWTLDSLHAAIREHAARQPWGEATELIDAVVDNLRGRARRS